MVNKHIHIQHKFLKDGFYVHSLWRDDPANMKVNNLSRCTRWFVCGQQAYSKLIQRFIEGWFWRPFCIFPFLSLSESTVHEE